MMKRSQKNRGVKWKYLFVCLFFFSESVIFLSSATPAYALGSGAVVVTADVPREIQKVQDSLADSLLSGVLGSLVSLASYFMRTLAYDTASYIASGGKGQGSLIFEKPFDEYLGDVALDSVGEAIDNLGDNFGLNLCQPPNLRLQAQIKVGLDQLYNQPTAGAGGTRPTSSCSWQTLTENWKDGVNAEVDIDAAASYASEVNVMETDFGFALGAIQSLEQLKATQEEAASLSALVGNGFKSVTDLVSGHINTPATVVNEEATALTAKHQGELSTQQIAGMYASDMWQIIPMSASVFLNTLTSQLLNRLFTNGLVPSEKERGGGIFDFYGVNSIITQRQIAQRAFSFLTARTGSKDPAGYNIVSAEFSVCPENPGLNNCVMNNSFKQALDRALVGQPVTIYEAVFGPNSYIPPSTELISPKRTADNASKNCYLNDLCYSNIQKMRKARIVPLGMEIAALRSDPDKPWTIGQVIQGFEDCPAPNPDGTITPDIQNHPFCHLINPNWILRAPEARCENRVYSPELLVTNAPQRREECADISTCITEDENGNCVDDKYYAYCTEEENIWTFPGQACAPEFASCKTYTNQASNEVVSYLSRTLEYGSCTANAVGCLPYVTEQNAADEWIGTPGVELTNKLYGAQQVVYLNERITEKGNTCPASAAGCNAFVGAVRDSATGAYQKDGNGAYIQDQNRTRNIKKAPNYLGCYDANPATAEVDYPQTALQLAQIVPDARCDAYASVCLPSEVGCESYTSVNGGESIPGVVGDNFCPASCVGYDTFKQEATNFEASAYPLYFIPQNGKSCSAQYAGCDEFTNLNATSQGGEQLEYYKYIKQCEVPTGTNSSVYYSWEGSETSGYVLKVHTLAKVGDNAAIPGEFAAAFPPNSPAYADDSVQNLSENQSICNPTLYNNSLSGTGEPADSDCRALYDSTGAVYYRLLAETVTVSSACHPLRKSESRLEATSYDNATCVSKDGYWDGNSCQVCVGGGSWVVTGDTPSEGSCVYYAIDAPGESVSCPAAANECRAYTGNSGNNTKPVFQPPTDTFEPEGDSAEALLAVRSAYAPSTELQVATEALQVNQHSLRVSGAPAADIVTRALPVNTMEQGASYELTFWARGAVQTMQIALVQGGTRWSLTTDPLTNQNNPVSISESWRQYHVGPVSFTGNPAEQVNLVFDRSNSRTLGLTGVYYIDTVSLTRTDGNVYLIRDSWKTAEGYDAPKECFSPSQDPSGALPGAALGCDAYTTSLGQRVYATGFERLCREEAVGCAPLWDTYNTDSPDAEVYNARCINGTPAAGGGVTPAVVTNTTKCEVTVAGDTYSCTISDGQSSCAIPGPVRIPSEDYLVDIGNAIGNMRIKSTPSDSIGSGPLGSYAMIDRSSVYIPADTPIDAPIYLTDTPETVCREQYLGCQMVALEEQSTPDNASVGSFTYTEQSIINNPSKYLGSSGTLCTQEQVACSAFTTSQGETSYFKDPSVNANKLCTYIGTNPANPTAPTGWFLKSVGQCSNNASIQCSTDDACGSGNTCQRVGESVPCYPSYQEDFASYGLWSNGSQGYDGYVGECPIGQNLCTELVDPYDVDTSGSNPDGKPYYIILDQQVTNANNDCNGQASLREGCVLFDQTDNPSKSFDVTATYEESERVAKKGNAQTLVTPISTAQNNANILLKVERNRQCSEWLACQSFEPIQTSSGQEIFACASFARCVAHDGNTCTEWAPIDQNAAPETKILDLKNYISRDTSWNGPEYTGYSLYNQYSIADLSLLTLKPEAGVTIPETVDTDNAYLGYVLPPQYFLDNPAAVACTGTKQTGDSCGIAGAGRCIAGDCVLPKDATTFASNETTIDRITTALGEAACKVPPEADSPYSPGIISLVEERDVHGFANDNISTDLRRYTYSNRPADANICQGDACTCNYVKLSYGSLVKDYWEANTYYKRASELSSWGICSGASDTEGDYCSDDADCGAIGRCQKIDRVEKLIGSSGQCLEYDLSRPLFDEYGNKTFACLTWYPSDKSLGQIDTYNLFQEAGYAPSIDAVSADGGAAGKVYCTESFGRDFSYEGTLTTHPFFNSERISGTGSTIVSAEGDFCINLTIDQLLFEKEDGGIVVNPLNFTAGKHCGSSMQDYKNNPYLWYACGTRFADQSLAAASSSCSNTNTSQYQRKDSINALYSLASLFGWKFIDTNAVVLRVEGDFQRENFGYRYSSGQTSGPYTISSLLPNPYGGQDTKTLFHAPRFEADGGTYTSQISVENGFITVDTTCLVAGGCPTKEDTTLEKTTLTEKYLNLQSLESVYFVPLRIPGKNGGDEDNRTGQAPMNFSREFKIDFNGQLGQKQNVLSVGGSEDTEIQTEVQNEPRFAITSYKLTRDDQSLAPCEGLISFCNYLGAGQQVQSSYNGLTQNMNYQYAPALGSSTSPETLERNQIAHRYVVVYHKFYATGDEDHDEPKFVAASPGHDFKGATSIDTDPFSSDCYYSTEGNNDNTTKDRYNYYAVGMDFNSDGEFLGYISRVCHEFRGSQGIQLAVIATMKNQCSEFTSVFRDTAPTDMSNKAWTNRVWKLSNFSLKADASLSDVFARSASRAPFGSVALSDEDLKNSSADTKQQVSLLQYAFADPKFGYPFFCDPVSTNDFDSLTLSGSCRVMLDSGYNSSNLNAIQAFGSTFLTGKQILTRLFAAYYTRVAFPYEATADTSGYDLNESDQAFVSSMNLVPPQIYALNRETCFPNESAINCSPSIKNAFTIGESYNEDIIAQGSYQARASFFGFADDNRMPIRRVMVDWQDGNITNEGTTGMYKNRKPYCESSNDVEGTSSLGYCANSSSLTLLTCKLDSDCPREGGYSCLTGDALAARESTPTPNDYKQLKVYDSFVEPRFGNLPRACEDKPFEYYHQYGCQIGSPYQTTVGTASISAATRARLISGGLTSDSPICVYQPRVQILDNWGYCNGSNTTDNGRTYVGPLESGWYNDLSASDPVCDTDTTFKAWTPYRGRIVVIP